MSRACKQLLVLWVIIGVGCAHQSVHERNESEMTATAEPKSAPVEKFLVTDPEPPQVVDQELEVIPEAMDEKVQQWVRYFQTRGRGHMTRYLGRSTRYLTLMKRILKQNGLPEDLVYIALIESGFSSRATSRAAAVGYWQFIKGTGRRYGLEINALVDERRDPVLATQAAAEYYRDLYGMFGSWYLAMASYNVGEGRVKRETARHATNSFWELARKKRLPKETVNYVPKFVAAKMIAKNPAKFGFTEIEYEKPIEFETVKLTQPLNLRTMATKMGLDYEDFKQLNPKFRGEVAPTKGFGVLELRVPVGQMQIAMGAAQESIVTKVELIADAGDTQTYKIKAGDSLSTIARKYRTTVSLLRDLNDLKAGRKLRVGMRIQVPERSPSKKPKVTQVAKEERRPSKPDDVEKAVTESSEVMKDGMVFYVVQPGDTLTDIAEEYDSSINELRKMNKLSKGSVLKAGMRLRVPKDDSDSSDPENSLASSGTEGGARRSNASLSRGTQRTSREVASVSRGSGKRKFTYQRVTPSKSRKAKKAKVHVVRRGENLSRIAAKYGISMESLKKKNQMHSGSKLSVGAKIFIPVAEASE